MANLRRVGSEANASHRACAPRAEPVDPPVTLLSERGNLASAFRQNLVKVSPNALMNCHCGIGATPHNECTVFDQAALSAFVRRSSVGLDFL